MLLVEARFSVERQLGLLCVLRRAEQAIFLPANLRLPTIASARPGASPDRNGQLVSAFSDVMNWASDRHRRDAALTGS
ncbi:hypothetical protein [Blastomonas sp. AAP53]|uniref:hypothetical protein n=1 Tax=Blastomonas sp. AAP53 TaxID=1248760 RepID=UPI00038072F3|nr:hypothetical protein [Blastomonas sp. AAP53]